MNSTENKLIYWKNGFKFCEKKLSLFHDPRNE